MPRKKIISNPIDKNIAAISTKAVLRNIRTEGSTQKTKDISGEFTQKNSVYDFTFDPDEEPVPKKKPVRKRRPRKNPIPAPVPQLKCVSTYEKNLTSKLNQLKSLVATKNTAIQTGNVSKTRTKSQSQSNTPFKDNPSDVNHSFSMIDKEPVAGNTDQYNISFFDKEPIANSSFKSVRSPAPSASPWRVDIDFNTKKWPLHVYVKPNMTPAYESTVTELNLDLNSKSNKSREVNPEKTSLTTQDSVNTTSNLKQTSILDFIREKSQSSTKKPETKNSLIVDRITPVKENSVFNDSFSSVDNTPNLKSSTLSIVRNLNFETPDKKSKIVSPKKKTLNKQKKPDKFFGFDDSEIIDQENIVPDENTNFLRKSRCNTRSQSRQALKEVNTIYIPPTEQVNNVGSVKFDHLIEEKGNETVNIEEQPNVAVAHTFTDEESSSNIALFEDIEVIHHNKFDRKSYGGKPQRRQHCNSSSSDSEVSVQSKEFESGSEPDDFIQAAKEFTFLEKNPPKKSKRRRKGKCISKKEKEEADQWAKSFNSMLQEVDEFPLTVE